MKRSGNVPAERPQSSAGQLRLRADQIRICIAEKPLKQLERKGLRNNIVNSRDASPSFSEIPHAQPGFLWSRKSSIARGDGGASCDSARRRTLVGVGAACQYGSRNCQQVMGIHLPGSGQKGIRRKSYTARS
ncbi:hypothetical protein VFPPC_18715 [Pochonia chlamydosporia 170]|uniref:Uncharacterized protein n=1 Tax=Pochonia chlamydosporia 170 TaxID=1380566 RepID=A0A219AS23_METCM|nr:hypothetical protein VFPPC_18715 [Pochonia chlamydosporia 170]OWT43558.1 hypothetical protein VFPPC_18715 [Pochonia chlamydosporia 170]